MFLGQQTCSKNNSLPSFLIVRKLTNYRTKNFEIIKFDGNLKKNNSEK